MTQQEKTLLVISNGEAEDAIACSIIDHLIQPGIRFIAAPIVSHGNSYRKRNIELCCPTAHLPSGGFANQSIKAISKDMKAGLGGLLISQFRAIRRQRKSIDGVIACGDILPQIMARFTGKPSVSIFTALSEYYIRRDDRHLKPRIDKLEKRGIWKSCVFPVFDRSLMRSRHSQGVFVRDALTNTVLQSFKVPSYFLGNPMMDHLEDSHEFSELNPKLPTLLLLPGSREPEVYANLEKMTKVLAQLKQQCNITLALAPSLDADRCQRFTAELTQKVHIYSGKFSALLNQANAAFSMCGTAAEQAIGKGIPVISIPGQGPQFSYKFAKRQQRLLGDSLFLMNEDTAASFIATVLSSPNTEAYQANGLNRMGAAGGSLAIAKKINELFELNVEFAN